MRIARFEPTISRGGHQLMQIRARGADVGGVSLAVKEEEGLYPVPVGFFNFAC